MNIFPDISRWEGKINFDVMRSKTDYVIMKASQGVVVDGEFERNRAECNRVGLPFGAYAFYDDRVSPGRQAAFFAGLFKEQKPVEIFCDWENKYNGDFQGIKNVVAFMQEVERLLGMEMGMYTGYWFFLENTNALLNIGQLNYLKKKKLWLAWYNDTYSNTGIMFVKVPRPWKKMDIWQFTDRANGHEYGCESAELDMNERISVAPTLPGSKSSLKLTQRVNFSDNTFQDMKEK